MSQDSIIADTPASQKSSRSSSTSPWVKTGENVSMPVTPIEMRDSGVKVSAASDEEVKVRSVRLGCSPSLLLQTVNTLTCSPGQRPLSNEARDPTTTHASAFGLLDDEELDFDLDATVVVESTASTEEAISGAGGGAVSEAGAAAGVPGAPNGNVLPRAYPRES